MHVCFEHRSHPSYSECLHCNSPSLTCPVQGYMTSYLITHTFLLLMLSYPVSPSYNCNQLNVYSLSGSMPQHIFHCLLVCLFSWATGCQWTDCRMTHVMLAGKSWENRGTMGRHSRWFTWDLCSPINSLCFKIAPGFIYSDTIQSRIFPSLLIIAILIFYLDYEPMPAGFSCVASFSMAEMRSI